jgi:Zn-dependent protease with chaperone function
MLGNFMFAEEKIGETTYRGKKVHLKCLNYLFAVQGIYELPAAGVKEDDNGEFTILVNTAWMAASRQEKEALLAHELGHIQCDHLKGFDIFSSINRTLGRDSAIQIELEADKVAIDNGHTEGLEIVLDKIEKFYNKAGINLKEIHRRQDQLTSIWIKRTFGN